MQANPAKFQYILFGTTENRRLELTGGIEVDALDCVKLLRVDIDKDLNFSTHISKLCKQHVLMRLSYILDINTKLTLFRCYMLSIFNFCCTV